MPDQIGNGDDTRDPLIEEPMDYTPIGEGLRSRLVSVERERDERDREIERLKSAINDGLADVMRMSTEASNAINRAERAEERAAEREEDAKVAINAVLERERILREALNHAVGVMETAVEEMRPAARARNAVMIFEQADDMIAAMRPTIRKGRAALASSIPEESTDE